MFDESSTCVFLLAELQIKEVSCKSAGNTGNWSLHGALTKQQEVCDHEMALGVERSYQSPRCRSGQSVQCP